MIYKLEIRRVALDMTIFSIDDDVAGKVPDAIFEIELACTALVGLDTENGHIRGGRLLHR